MDEANDFIHGTCYLMCPEKEIKERKDKALVHYFERAPESVSSQRSDIDSSLMVKEYRRPVPGKVMPEPSDLRPADVLIKTVNYLFHNIIPRANVPWYRVYEFVFDRLRAVRQDMVIQRIGGNAAIWILESSIRFLIYSGYRLHMEPMDNFDPEINRIHTLECLKRLMILYDEENVCHCRQGQFLALYILFNVHSSDAVFTSLQLKDTFISCDIFKTSLSLWFAWQHRNFIRVFHLLSRLPFLHFCAVHHHLHNFRCLALEVISRAVGRRAQQLPVSQLATWLGCSSDDVSVLCSSCGFTVNNDTVSVSQPVFRHPQKVQLRTCELELREASSETLSDLLCGERCTVECSASTRVEELHI